MFKFVPVEINNNYNFSIESHPVSVGVPCPEGEIFSDQQLTLNFKGQAKQSHITPLAKWPDGSMKWFLLDFQVSAGANEQSLFQLVADKSQKNSSPQPAQTAQIVVSDVEDKYLVDTGPAQFTVDKHRLGVFDQVVYNHHALLADGSSCVQLMDEQGNPASSVVTAIRLSEKENTLRKKINIEGFFQRIDGKNLVAFNLKLTFYAGLSTVKAEFTLSNPQAAEHPGGVWDLGDKGSFFFKSLSVKIQLAKADEYNASIRLSPDADLKLAKNGNLMLDQNSSGGENWQSKNHVNGKGEVPLEFKGFRYFEQQAQVDSGNRANPVVHLASDNNGITAHVVDFWQNFPKGIETEQSVLLLNLFPQRASDCHELQGG
ncbi:MAG: hypothetical protein KAT90_01355, partial [Gammaproteobacteria bacterium]|nr:hypothetical protein [Gammaproteobacteria bacterium]